MNDKKQYEFANPKSKNLSGYCENGMCATCRIKDCDCDCHKDKGD